MECSLRAAALDTRAVGLLAVGVPEGAAERDSPAARLEAATHGALKVLRAAGDFSGKSGETALLYPTGVRAKRVLVVGLGTAKAVDARALYLAAATASRRASPRAAC